MSLLPKVSILTFEFLKSLEFKVIDKYPAITVERVLKVCLLSKLDLLILL